MSTLFVVPVPIGNVKDITLRAMDVLKDGQFILCEDTRNTKKLLDLLKIDSIDKRFLPYFEHNESQKLDKAIDLLKEGIDLVLVSDAGTPLLSDPGFILVREIRKSCHDIKIEVLPGASSITTSLVTSGLPTDKFTFLGYLSKKPNDKKKLFKSCKKSAQFLKSTYIAFETMTRIESTLEMMSTVLGKDTHIVLCAELTKIHERVIDKSISDHLNSIRTGQTILKGELVILFNLKKYE